MCLTTDDFRQLATAARNLLLDRRKQYKGQLFEQDLSELSGVPREQIQALLEAKDDGLETVLTGVEWERVLSAAHVYPEDMVEMAKFDISKMAEPPKSRFGASAYSCPKPDHDADLKIRMLFDVMSDFFLLASVKPDSREGCGHAAAS